MTEQNNTPETGTTGRVVPKEALFVNHIQFKVILADDTSYDGQAYFDSYSKDLHVSIFPSAHASLVEVFPVFTNPEKTAIIKSQIVDTDEPQIFEGYTTLVSIRQNEQDGGISIDLSK